MAGCPVQHNDIEMLRLPLLKLERPDESPFSWEVRLIDYHVKNEVILSNKRRVRIECPKYSVFGSCDVESRSITLLFEFSRIQEDSTSSSNSDVETRTIPVFQEMKKIPLARGHLHTLWSAP